MERSQLFRAFESIGIDEKNPDLLKGVLVCEKGEALGHGFFLGEKFLKGVIQATKGKLVKVRLDHPEDKKPGKLLSIVGEASNFRLDGDKVRADVRLFDVPAKSVLQTLAKQASSLFGMSLDFAGGFGTKLVNGLKERFCSEVSAVDFVESPAATTSLFSTAVDSKGNGMNLSLPNEMLAALKLGENPDEKAVLAALGNAIESAGKYSAKMAEEKAAEDKKKEDEKLAEEAKKKEDEKASEEGELEKKVSGIVERLATKLVTDRLAKIGVDPKISLTDKPEDKKEEELSPKEAELADKLGFKGDERKAFLANLKKTNSRL